MMKSWKNGREVGRQKRLFGCNASEWMVKRKEEGIQDDTLEGIGNDRT